MKKRHTFLGACILLIFMACQSNEKEPVRSHSFNAGWKFNLGDVGEASSLSCDDHSWRVVNLPHDWAIEGDFDKNHPAGDDGGALPGGIGWYRKTFTMNEADKEKKIFIDFDGVYMNSEVFINGISLGVRPYGYISFRYDLTPYLRFDETNTIAVRVDNEKQPSSRWYSGCGIYRNVWLTVVDPVHVDLWGTYVTTPEVTAQQATVRVVTTVKNNRAADTEVEITSCLLDQQGKEIGRDVRSVQVKAGGKAEGEQVLALANPHFWTVEEPYLYNVKTELRVNGRLTDTYSTTTGVRTFRFDVEKGFFLNEEPMKINGVCMHHDLGCLGAAVNTRAIERQLEILKEMGCNAIRC